MTVEDCYVDSSALRQHTPSFGTRSLDVLHVASALELKARLFVTYDQKQSRLAGARGLNPTFARRGNRYRQGR